MIWAGSFAAVIFMGTIYGAGLKTQQEWKAVSLSLRWYTTQTKYAHPHTRTE